MEFGIDKEELTPTLHITVHLTIVSLVYPKVRRKNIFQIFFPFIFQINVYFLRDSFSDRSFWRVPVFSSLFVFDD